MRQLASSELKFPYLEEDIKSLLAIAGRYCFVVVSGWILILLLTTSREDFYPPVVFTGAVLLIYLLI